MTPTREEIVAALKRAERLIGFARREAALANDEAAYERAKSDRAIYDWLAARVGEGQEAAQNRNTGGVVISGDCYGPWRPVWIIDVSDGGKQP